MSYPIDDDWHRSHDLSVETLILDHLMGQQIFNRIWYSDKKRHQSIAKSRVFSDKGTLKIGHDSLEFNGRKNNFRISNMKSIEISRQRPPLIGYLIGDIYVAPIAAVFVLVGDMPIEVAIAIPIAWNALGILLAYTAKWVKIEFTDENGVKQVAFFSMNAGWGTDTLFRAIKSQSRFPSQ